MVLMESNNLTHDLKEDKKEYISILISGTVVKFRKHYKT